MSEQPRIALNDGRLMPQLGYGVFLVPPQDTKRLVTDAIELGYQAIDTATFYRNEAEVGEAVRDCGQTVFVTTKLWNDDQGHEQTLRAFDASYEALGLETIDLYLIHWPKPAKDLYVESWKALIRLRAEGRVKTIGVSNFTMEHLERIIHDTGVVPAVNQVELHPYFQQVELRAFHDENAIVTTSWSPLGRGGDLNDPVIAKIAKRHGKTPAQIIIRWQVENGLSVIPKSSSRTRQAENLDVFGFQLDVADIEAIAALDRRDGRIGPDPDAL